MINTCPDCFGLGRKNWYSQRLCYGCKGTGIYNDVTISIIVAMTINRVIGKDGELPWHLPGDLKYFKETTYGKPLIMGRKTYESIPSTLPGRPKVIITRQENYAPKENDDNVICIASSLDEAVAACYSESPSEIMIIGGAEVYKEALDRDFVDKIYLTRIHNNFDGDIYFPILDDKWDIKISVFGGIEISNGIGYSHNIYERA